MKTLQKKNDYSRSLFVVPNRFIDCLCLVFIDARYSKYMKEITCFGRKGCLSIHSLRWKFLKVERGVGKGFENIFIFTHKVIGPKNKYKKIWFVNRTNVVRS